MAERTCVWVKTDILTKQKTNKLSTTTTNDEEEWTWHRCLVLSGDISTKSNLTVQVADQESEFHGQTIQVDTSESSSGPDGIQMANQWAVAEALAGGSSSSSSSPPDDLITLTHLHEPSVVFCLKRRYQRDLIYTATGPILIALNPFKALRGTYGEDVMSQYWAQGEGFTASASASTRSINGDSSGGNGFVGESNLKPHVFGKADDAFRKMMASLELQGVDGTNSNSKGGGSSSRSSITASMSSAILPPTDQSILVSGESGAGKTVTTKHIMKYLAQLSQRKADHWKRRRAPSPGRRGGDTTSVPFRKASGGALQGATLSDTEKSPSMTRRVSRAQSWKHGAQIEEKILQSNPILESFGNARTIRNDNSSRFGKFVELQFNHFGSLIGASIETYLLEKVRLIHQNDGERNFHVFYEMLAGATDNERKDYFLEDPATQSSYTIQDFHMTNSSGTYDRRDGEDDGELFEKLVDAMGTMGFEAKTQEQIFTVTVAFLHASNLTFEYVTDDSSKVDTSNPHLEPVLKLLGLELSDFQDALCSFEIEAGNTSYTRTVNKELAEKGLEGLIKSTYGAMFNFIVQNVNKKIDHKTNGAGAAAASIKKAAFIGVLDIFGFESFRSNSFEQLCINYCNEALQQQFNLHIFKTEQEEYKKEGIAWEFIEFPDNQDVIELIFNRKSTGILSILSDQSRAVRGGSDKTFAENMYQVCEKHPRFEATSLHKGKRQFVIHHYAGPVTYETVGFVEKNKDEIPRGAANLLESSKNELVQLLGKISAPAAPASSGGGRGNKSKSSRATVGTKFASQLAELRNRIEMTLPHYIRCLKPNQLLEPDNFNNAMIADQLRYAGVLEAIRVSRVGYSQRYLHNIFIDRYRFIALNAVQKAAPPKKIGVLTAAVAKMIFEAENPQAAPPADVMSAVGIQKGSSKVFLRQHAFEYLERFRAEQLNRKVTTIQAHARRFLVRCYYVRTLRRIIIVQSCVRRYMATCKMEHLRLKRASTFIQKQFRMHQRRTLYLQQKVVALWFQRMTRGKAGRKRFTELYNARQAELARIEREYKAAVAMQCLYRSHVARNVKDALKKEKEELKRKESLTSVSETVQHLRDEQTKAGLRAAQAQAVAKQTKQDANREVEELRLQLEQANVAQEKDRQNQEEMMMLRAALAEMRAQLEESRMQTGQARSRVTALEAENAQLKEILRGGAGNSMDLQAMVYSSTTYDDHSDLQQLDQRIHNMAVRSRQSRRDLDALVQSLAILR